MSHSQFHCTSRAYLDMHGLIFETSICYWQDQPGRSAVSQRERAPRGGTRLTVDRAYGARGRYAARAVAAGWRRWRRAGGGGPPPPGAREPAGRERRSRRARRAHSRRAPSHPAASERDGLTDPAPAGPGQRRRRRGEAGEDTHTSPPPTRADPQQPGGGARGEGRSPGQVAPRLAQQAGAHAHAGRGPGRDPGTPPPGGGRAVAGQPTTDEPGPGPRPGARAPEREVGGGTAEEGDGRSPPSAHNTAAGPDGGGGHGEEAAAGLGGAHTPERATGFGNRTEEATTRTAWRQGQRGAGEERRGNRAAGPTAKEPHTGFQTRRLDGAEPSRHRGAHGVPPPEASSTRAVPWHPRTPTRPTPLSEPWGQTLAEGPPALPPAAAARPAPGTLSRTRGDPPTAPHPPRPDPRRAQPAPLSLLFPPFLHSHASGADRTPPGTRPPKSHSGPRGGRAPDKRRGLVSVPTR